MINQIKEQIETVATLQQLAWYAGYIAACKDHHIITMHEHLVLKRIILNQERHLKFLIDR